MKKVCAVIVTYNRVDLLKESISFVRGQSFSCDILVIDNHSSDGTQVFLENSGIDYFRTERNLGGAGGFNIGIRIAYERGYDYIWIMDDDCMPDADSLEKLIDAAVLVNDDFGFLASKVLWTDGSIHRMNRINYDPKDLLTDHIYKIDQATFVSLLFKRSVIEKCGLPIKDFFIWGDDIEFTRRISKRMGLPSYYVDNSVVVHKTMTNIGSKIAYDEIEKIERYRYAYRNEAYLYRQEGIKGIIYYILKCIYNVLRIILFSKDNKRKRMAVLFSGIREGIHFDPAVEYV